MFERKKERPLRNLIGHCPATFSIIECVMLMFLCTLWVLRLLRCRRGYWKPSTGTWAQWGPRACCWWLVRLCWFWMYHSCTGSFSNQEILAFCRSAERSVAPQGLRCACWPTLQLHLRCLAGPVTASDPGELTDKHLMTKTSRICWDWGVL